MRNPSAISHPDAFADELRKFQGVWIQTAWEKDGVPQPPDEPGRESRTTFIGATFVVTLTDGTPVIQGSFRLDPTREPRAVDWTDTFGSDAGKTFPAIYVLDGDRLIFCVADEGCERPTEFRTRPGQVLRALRRETQ